MALIVHQQPVRAVREPPVLPTPQKSSSVVYA